MSPETDRGALVEEQPLVFLTQACGAAVSLGDQVSDVGEAEVFTQA